MAVIGIINIYFSHIAQILIKPLSKAKTAFVIGIKVALLLAYATNTVNASNQTFIETPDSHLANCGTQYAQASLPQVTTTKPIDLYYLCFDGFAVGYSGVTRTALWSAEHLTRERIEVASTLERENQFHEESRLPNSVKSSLADYKKVPYDRGHLAPNADMATREQQYDSFSLANIVPQDPTHNRNLWKNLETNTRYLAIKNGQIYVVTGVVFKGNAIKQLNKRILIPTHLYKAIYIPSLGQAGVYYTPNDDSQRVEVISLNELSKRTGIDSFPEVSAAAKNTAMALPTTAVSQKNPTSSSNHASTNPSHKADTADANLIIKLITAIIVWLINLFK